MCIVAKSAYILVTFHAACRRTQFLPTCVLEVNNFELPSLKELLHSLEYTSNNICDAHSAIVN